MGNVPILAFPRRCSVLETAPLAPLAGIIGIFAIAVPVLLAFALDPRARVRSISYGWRQPYNIYSLFTAFILIIVSYMGVCAYSGGFLGIMGAGLALATLIITCNPDKERTDLERKLAMVHRISAATMFTYLLVLQILIFTSGTIALNTTAFRVFITACVFAVLMPVTMFKRPVDPQTYVKEDEEYYELMKKRTLNWNMATSACEIAYTILTIIVFASIPSAQIVG